MTKKKIHLNQHLNFNAKFTASAINVENKSVSFILSDETIVGRGWFDMKLLHGENNVNLERESILKVFYNHDSRALPIGKWENLRVEDKQLKANAVFDEDDEFAMKIFGKLERGFLESISVGISLEKYDIKQRDKQNDLVVAKKWSVFEASVVNIPAIPNAKVGLELDQEEKPNKEKNSMTLEELKAEHPELFAEVLSLGVTQESNRVEAIDKILKPELAQHFTDMKYDGKSTSEQIELAQFRKIADMSVKERDELKKHKNNVDLDGLNLGKQVLDMNLAGGGDDNKDAEKLAKEKAEQEEDGNAFFSGVGGAKK